MSHKSCQACLQGIPSHVSKKDESKCKYDIWYDPTTTILCNSIIWKETSSSWFSSHIIFSNVVHKLHHWIPTTSKLCKHKTISSFGFWIQQMIHLMIREYHSLLYIFPFMMMRMIASRLPHSWWLRHSFFRRWWSPNNLCYPYLYYYSFECIKCTQGVISVDIDYHEWKWGYL